MPFDVERMGIRCNGWAPGEGDVFFVSGKGSYALNGNAKATFADRVQYGWILRRAAAPKTMWGLGST
ncbi:hypothetical protein ABIB57_001966 [Devosia sp. UYZn731]